MRTLDKFMIFFSVVALLFKFTFEWLMLSSLELDSGMILPSSRLARERGGGDTRLCFAPRHGLDSELVARLAEVQYDEESARKHSTSNAMRLHRGRQGFGVQFISYYSSLSASLRNRSALFFFDQFDWNYADSTCKSERNSFVVPPQSVAVSNSLDCFFDRTISQSVRSIVDSKTRRVYEVLLPHVNAYRNIDSNSNSNDHYLNGTGDTAAFPNMEDWRDMLVPPSWSRMSIRQWESQIAASLFCLRKEIVEIADETMRKIEWNRYSNVIAVHMRYGDRTDLKRFDFGSYLAKIEQFAAAIDAKRAQENSRSNSNEVIVFVATDDPKYVRESIARMGSGKWELRFVISAENGESFANYQMQNSSIESTYRMLVDLELIARANYFVGSQRSLFSWLASRLQLGRSNSNACAKWVDVKAHRWESSECPSP
jgi:hypothetical protein